MINTKSAITVLWTTLTIVIIFGSFILKNQVHDLEKELSRVNQNIQKDVSSIHILKAEWSHLNRPTRIRQLASEHISLNKVRAEQIINYSALPFANENQVSESKLASNAHQKELKKLVKAER